MKTTYYLDGKKTTKKLVSEMYGAERINRFTKESEEMFRIDPNIENDYFMGKHWLSIAFE